MYFILKKIRNQLELLRNHIFYLVQQNSPCCDLLMTLMHRRLLQVSKAIITLYSNPFFIDYYLINVAIMPTKNCQTHSTCPVLTVGIKLVLKGDASFSFLNVCFFLSYFLLSHDWLLLTTCPAKSCYRIQFSFEHLKRDDTLFINYIH